MIKVLRGVSFHCPACERMRLDLTARQAEDLLLEVPREERCVAREKLDGSVPGVIGAQKAELGVVAPSLGSGRRTDLVQGHDGRPLFPQELGVEVPMVDVRHHDSRGEVQDMDGIVCKMDRDPLGVQTLVELHVIHPRERVPVAPEPGVVLRLAH